MDPIEVREERVAPGGPAAGTPVAAAPVAAAPVAAGGVTSSRVGVYPVAYRAVNLVWLVVGIIIAILAFDFFFRLAAANDVGFASFIYGVGGVLAAPFDGIFGISTAVGTRSVIRWSDLLAMVVYALIGALIVKVVRIASAPRPGQSI
ncbi:MAG: hypothetical protein ABR541_03005 [Candidatus Dormibacteria bacterium]